MPPITSSQFRALFSWFFLVLIVFQWAGGQYSYASYEVYVLHPQTDANSTEQQLINQLSTNFGLSPNQINTLSEQEVVPRGGDFQAGFVFSHIIASEKIYFSLKQPEQPLIEKTRPIAPSHELPVLLVSFFQSFLLSSHPDQPCLPALGMEDINQFLGLAPGRFSPPPLAPPPQAAIS